MDWRLEEDPDVGTITGAGPFEDSWDLSCVARIDECERVEGPAVTVEVTGQQGARVASDQGIDPDRGLTAQM